ncbi:hypothetical protein D3C71_1044610 [compost metagenome]
MLVWKAMESITPMMSEIFCDAALMPCMVLTTWATTSPPWVATVLALAASWLACWALSAFWRTVALSCSIEAAVSSSALAWLSVRAERSVLPWAICTLAVATFSEPLRTWRTTCVSWLRICCSACSSWPTSLVPWASGAPLRSPCATARDSATACDSGTVIERTNTSAMPLVAESVMTSARATHSSPRCRSDTRACSAWSRLAMDRLLSAFSASMVRVKASK